MRRELARVGLGEPAIDLGEKDKAFDRILHRGVGRKLVRHLADTIFHGFWHVPSCSIKVLAVTPESKRWCLTDGA